jgi:GNAT superfamily N-acetyltransferase
VNIEIRSYDGDGSDLAEFVRNTWIRNLGGRSWFPLWDVRFFRWRLLDPRVESKDLLVCAYDGTALVGCVLAEALDFEVLGRRIRGTLCSFLTVAPEARRDGLAMRLMETLRARQRERGMRVSFGLTVSGDRSPARRFWQALGARYPGEVQFLGPIWMWTRVFDPPAVAAAGLDAFERFAPLLAPRWPWGRIGPDAAVRRFTDGDLPRCLEWVEAQSRASGVRIVWSQPRLQMQLGHGTYPKTLVFDDGDTGGFINYHVIDWSGARPITMAVIDLLAGSLDRARMGRLLRAAIRAMRAEAVQMAMMRTFGGVPSAVLLSAGFVPVPSGTEALCLFADATLQLPARTRLHLLFT